ncbi:MAG: hypothetical protein AAF224_10800 [Pseudomonadota bacterium]
MTYIRWGAALIIGGFLLFFGATKFSGGAHIFPYIEYKATALNFPFADLFYPFVNWATGALEIVAGALLILPMTRRLGAGLAVLPFLGAIGFHLSPLLGVVTPDGYAAIAPSEALVLGGPFTASDFSAASSPALFTIAAAMLVVAIVNVVLQRRA